MWFKLANSKQTIVLNIITNNLNSCSLLYKGSQSHLSPLSTMFPYLFTNNRRHGAQNTKVIRNTPRGIERYFKSKMTRSMPVTLLDGFIFSETIGYCCFHKRLVFRLTNKNKRIRIFILRSYCRLILSELFFAPLLFDLIRYFMLLSQIYLIKNLHYYKR